MAVKHIQLRGISRTPSDRMTEDGGCAESLNVQLDTSEIAPALAPEDVSTKLNLPPGLQAEKLFVHKTASYENIIFAEYFYNRTNLNIGVISNGKRKIFLTLDDNEQINDITAIGNTLVIAGTLSMHYVLYAGLEYKYLGTRVPVPHVEFQSISNYYAKGRVNFYSVVRDGNPTTANLINTFDVDIWNKAVDDRKKGNSSTYTTRIKEIEEGLWEEVKAEIKKFRDQGQFVAPFFVRVAVRLYDGSYINHSVPILLGSGFNDFLTISGYKIMPSSSEYSSEIRYQLQNIFDVKAYLKKWDTDGWEDIVKSIDIFASTNVYFPFLNAQLQYIKLTKKTENSAFTSYEYEMQFDHGDKDYMESLEDELLSHSVFYKIGSFPLNNDKLSKGWKLDNAKNLRSDTDLMLTEDRLDDVLISDEIISQTAVNYNNRILNSADKVLASRGYSFINAANIAIGNNTRIPKGPYALKYHIKGASEASVLGKAYDDSYLFKPYEMDTSDEGGSSTSQSTIYGFIAHPNPNCYKVEVWTSEDVYTIPMKAHPRLNCSYGFWGLSETLDDFPAASEVKFNDFSKNENRQINKTWKLYVSKADNPFLWQQTLTMQSKVVGMATVTSALSQGQFGQFPLYVFTEEGIWVVETAADGSFINQKPLSRDVCINPASITSIDNGVVFVTAQGVMLLQGSQIVNISPNMNGRHYVIENTPRTIIENQDFFCDLLPALSDNTHFLAFVKEATVAYDYAGRRLIFIKKDEKYQYIYKLDTQTWHKSAYDIDLVAPINSYPECLVQGKGKRSGEYAYVTRQDTQEELDYIVGRIRIVLPDVTSEEVQLFLEQKTGLDVTNLSEGDREWLYNELNYYHVLIEYVAETEEPTCIYDLSTLLDAQESQTPTRGIIATRPLDLGEPDVFKTITDVRIRGQFPKGAVKFILLGSNDGINFATLSTLRGRSWKLFRIIILADLAPTERISWIDVQYETTFTNKLR